MKKEITVRIVDIVGGSLCVSASDGQRVYDKIVPLIRDGKQILLSFRGVETLISAFLNAAIGQLYGEFDEELIRRQLSVSDISDDDLVILKRVVENAKLYFKDPQRFKRIMKEEIGDEE